MNWENLTSPNFAKAVEQSGGVCIVPMGVLEKHGPHLPLGTDCFNAYGLCSMAAEQEYCVVFPFYYVGQINEARNQRGTVSYSPELVYKMLQETCDEIARNGFKKIILYSYHGGNGALVQYFCQNQLSERRDYIVYQGTHSMEPEAQKVISKMRKSKTGGHADELETSTILVLKPGLAQMQDVNTQSGEDLNRLPLKNLRPGIWWYASYPNHYAGESSGANEKLGEEVVKDRVNVIVQMIKAVKADNAGPAIQEQYFDEVDNMLKK